MSEGGEFDFSELLNHIKFKFWTYERTQERFKRQRSRLANRAFSQQGTKNKTSVCSQRVMKALKTAASRFTQNNKSDWKPDADPTK